MAFICMVYLLLTLPMVAGLNDSVSQYQMLYKNLGDKVYGKMRPVFNQSMSVKVDIQIFLKHIQVLNEKEQFLQSAIALSCRWKYETLSWNKILYGGIEKINLSPKDVWIPNLIVSNTIDSLFVLLENNDDINSITVLSNGDAVWYTGGIVRTSCSVDISKYPFDTQTCSIIIGKIEYDNEVYLTAAVDKVGTETYNENGEWKLKSAMVQTRLIYPDVTYLYINLTLSRHTLYSTLNLILPVALLSFVMALSFKIPPASGERLSYNMALLLTFVVLLNLIDESMPRVSKRVSFLHMYVNYQLTVAVVITALSIMLVNLTYSQHDANVSLIVKLYSGYYEFRKKNKSFNLTTLEEDGKAEKTEGIQGREMEAESLPVRDNDVPIDIQIVVQHVGDAFSRIFLTMYLISTILFSLLIAI